jgi:glutathione S-transferase
MIRLYTFTISHFSEKARWALDCCNVAYEEQRLLPGPHILTTRRFGGATSVPLLCEDGRVVQGSAAIIDFAARRPAESGLTPPTAADAERARELEPWLDRELGETLRRFFYFHALAERKLVVELFSQGGPRWARAFYRVGYGPIADRIRKMYAIDAETAQHDRDRLSAALEALEERLAGRKYLVGDRFSRADLTLAALAAPLCDPPEHPTRWPSDDLYPRVVSTFRARFAGTHTHAHVLRTYREHRRPARAAAAVD